MERYGQRSSEPAVNRDASLRLILLRVLLTRVGRPTSGKTQGRVSTADDARFLGEPYNFIVIRGTTSSVGPTDGHKRGPQDAEPEPRGALSSLGLSSG